MGEPKTYQTGAMEPGLRTWDWVHLQTDSALIFLGGIRCYLTEIQTREMTVFGEGMV